MAVLASDNSGGHSKVITKATKRKMRKEAGQIGSRQIKAVNSIVKVFGDFFTSLYYTVSFIGQFDFCVGWHAGSGVTGECLGEDGRGDDDETGKYYCESIRGFFHIYMSYCVVNRVI